jgi:8-oxo-dGTP pyrophosphatase MutT (NUDIX family)
VERTVKERERRPLAGAGQRSALTDAIPPFDVRRGQRSEGAGHVREPQVGEMPSFEQSDPSIEPALHRRHARMLPSLAVASDDNVDEALTHGGGAVIRSEAGTLKILLVRAKPAPHDWVLPKGHIEPGETAKQTAEREVAEEAGVDAVANRYLGAIEFVSPKGEQVRAGYFLMAFRGDVPPAEEREIRWCTADDALKRIRFDDTRALIRDAFHFTKTSH